MSNHLIIGLGGTGGRILRALRKTMYTEHREQPKGDIHLEYLYVDSDERLMTLDDPSWKVLGHSVQLGMNQQLRIKGGADLAKTLDNINTYPGIRPWIGQRDIWRDILGDTVGDVLGGQKRRLGRFLFSMQVERFKERVQGLVRALREQGAEHGVTFHVCAGLAGGTGGGSVVDALCQLRRMYPDTDQFRIFLYILLPDQHPKPNWNTGNYHANGYAALLELNALSIGAWQPYDIARKGDHEPERLGAGQLQRPFNGCYLFGNENENGLAVDVEHDLPGIVADFLYHKLVVVRLASLDQVRRLEDAENGTGEPEKRPGSNIPERGRTFLGFGIKRLAIPETEIKEYMIYRFCEQASLQMLFNHWTESEGFIEEALPEAFGAKVRDPAILQSWLLSDAHLCLSLGILDDEAANRAWRPIGEDWQHAARFFLDIAKQHPNRSQRINELEKQFQNRYDKQYREQGVQEFYRIKTQGQGEHVAKIRRTIERLLFDDWKNGNLPLYAIGQLLDALLLSLEERYQRCSEHIEEHRKAVAVANEKVQANKKEFAVMGKASDHLLGKGDKLLEAQALCLQEKYTQQTYVAGWDFAKGLLAALKTEFSSLRGEVNTMFQRLLEAKKAFVKNSQERCRGNGQNDLKSQTVQFYNPEAVKDFTRRLVLDKRVQQGQSSRVRAALLGLLGDNPGFASFNQRLLTQQVLDLFEVACEKESQAAHDEAIVSHPDLSRSHQFGVNLVDKLAREFSGSDERIKKYMHDLVRYAGNYLVFDEGEMRRQAAGVPTNADATRGFYVLMPKGREHPAYSAQLTDILRGCYGQGVHILESDLRPNEITFISLSCLFPLRYIKHMQFLQSEYRRVVGAKESARKRLEVHTEGDEADYPGLFLQSQEDLRAAAARELLLAQALGIISEYRNPETGFASLLYIRHDEYGLEAERIALGQNLLVAVDKVGVDQVESLRSANDEKLKAEYRHVERQAELKRGLAGLVNGIRDQECGGNIDDPRYKLFLNASQVVFSRIGT